MPKKKLILITSIISTILTFFYILLLYFGITRYIEIYIKNPNKYLQNYNKLSDASEKNRSVIVILNYNIDKNKNLKLVLNSVLDQTVKVDTIYIITDLIKKIPKYVNNIATVIQRDDADPTGSNDLISILNREYENNTNIIILTSKMIYGIDTVEYLVETSNKHVDSVIYSKTNKNKIININYGLLVKPKFFKTDFILNKNNISFIEYLKNNKIEKTEKINTYYII